MKSQLIIEKYENYNETCFVTRHDYNLTNRNDETINAMIKDEIILTAVFQANKRKSCSLKGKTREIKRLCKSICKFSI